MNEELINIDYLKNLYFKSLLPLDKVSDFISMFDKENYDRATATLISILNLAVTSSLLENFHSIEEKQEFLRLCQDDYQDPKILDFLTDKFPDSQHNIQETIDRTILFAKMMISE